MTVASVLPIDAILVEGRHRRDLGDIKALAESIREVSLLHPIVVTPDHRLVAGERRLAACRLLGFEEVPVRVADTLNTALSQLRAERDENTCRKEMTPTELVALTDALLALERPKAEDRMKAGKAPYVPGNTGSAADIAAKAAGWSRASYARTKKVIAAATDETEPEPVRQVAQAALADIEAGAPIRRAVNKVAAAKIVHAPTKPRHVPLHKQARPEILHKTRRIDPNRVVQATVDSAAALSAGQDLYDFASVDVSLIPGWVSSLEESIRFLTTLKKNLNKELTRA